MCSMAYCLILTILKIISKGTIIILLKQNKSWRWPRAQLSPACSGTVPYSTHTSSLCGSCWLPADVSTQPSRSHPGEGQSQIIRVDFLFPWSTWNNLSGLAPQAALLSAFYSHPSHLKLMVSCVSYKLSVGHSDLDFPSFSSVRDVVGVVFICLSPAQGSHLVVSHSKRESRVSPRLIKSTPRWLPNKVLGPSSGMPHLSLLLSPL